MATITRKQYNEATQALLDALGFEVPITKVKDLHLGIQEVSVTYVGDHPDTTVRKTIRVSAGEPRVRWIG